MGQLILDMAFLRVNGRMLEVERVEGGLVSTSCLFIWKQAWGSDSSLRACNHGR